MTNHIDRDLQRFNEKLRRLTREGLDKYFETGTLHGARPNGGVLQIPIRKLNLPHFEYGENGGVGQGEGQLGQPIDTGTGKPGTGHGRGIGERIYGTITQEEAAEILGRKLQLPNLIETFEGKSITNKQKRYTNIQRRGPESLRHFRRTFKQALLREITSGTYDPKNPLIILFKEDRRYRAARQVTKPTTNAVIIYLLDRSGSTLPVIDFMQQVGWWADAWIQHHHPQVQRVFIHYDSAARVVPPKEFYTILGGGGTSMAAGFSVAKREAKKFPPEQYNLYLIHFTDGDCSELEVTAATLEMYKWFEEMSKESFSELEMETGNALTDYFIPRANAILVCEADVGFGGQSGVNIAGEEYQGNYSGLLAKLCERKPSLNKKIRVSSYKANEILESRGDKILKTLMNWFS